MKMTPRSGHVGAFVGVGGAAAQSYSMVEIHVIAFSPKTEVLNLHLTSTVSFYQAHVTVQ